MVACALPAAAAPALAQPDVDALEATAIADFQAGRYREAVRSFERLYRLRPEPSTLFAMGRCYQELGECARAREIFEDYLASEPDPAGRRAAEERMAACAPVPVEAPPVPVEPPPVPVEAPPVEAPTGAVQSRRPLVLGLAGAGLAAAGGAIVLEVFGRGALDEATEAGRLGDQVGYDDALAAANRYHRSAQVVGVVAVGLGVSAAVLWWTRPRAASSVALAPTTSGGLVTWSGAF